MNRQERRAAAKKSKTTAPTVAADTPAAQFEAALALARAGRRLEAQLCCERSLALDPTHAETLHLMGLLALQEQQVELAVAWISRAVRQSPKPDYLVSLGTALSHQGRHDEALKTFDTAVQLKPGDPDLWRLMGDALAELGRHDEALLSFGQALALEPRHRHAAFRRGAILHQLGRFDEALADFARCTEWNSKDAQALRMQAQTLRDLGRFDEALVQANAACALAPADAESLNDLGAVLQSLGRDTDAVEAFGRAVALQPTFIKALNNRAHSLTQLHRFDEAEAIYRRVLALDPTNGIAEWNLALQDMLLGRFETGWAGREARWRALPVAFPNLPQPMWLGHGEVAGKTILIGADEGLGDTLQFARYVPMLVARGARVLMIVADPLQPLFADLPGVIHCIPKSKGAQLPPFDMHIPLASLPFAFRTRMDSIPPGDYLPRPPQARVDAWTARLGTHDKLRVGLVWSGNAKHQNDHNRSLALARLAPLFELDASFISLQKDPRESDLPTLRAARGIVDMTADLTDFVETAALVSCLDLVVTVDTSVAHLAAALGRPTWIMLPWTPDYRWLLDRDDSPWYPSVRLFRQDEARDYTDVVARVRRELSTKISAFASGKR